MSDPKGRILRGDLSQQEDHLLSVQVGATPQTVAGSSNNINQELIRSCTDKEKEKDEEEDDEEDEEEEGKDVSGSSSHSTSNNSFSRPQQTTGPTQSSIPNSTKGVTFHHLHMPLELHQKVNGSKTCAASDAVAYVLDDPSVHTSHELSAPMQQATATLCVGATAHQPQQQQQQQEQSPPPSTNMGPGAYPVIGISGVSDNLPHINDNQQSLVFGVTQVLGGEPENNNTTNNINLDPGTQPNNHGLVRAELVEDDIDLEEAQPVASEELEARGETQQERKDRPNGTIIGIAIAGLFAFVAFVVGVVSGTRINRDDKNNDSSTMASNPDLQFTKAASNTIPPSTLYPTEAPSPEPDPLKALLPEDTLVHLLDPFSTQHKAYTWVMNRNDFSTLPDWRITQLFALACFYFDNAGTTWPQGLDRNWLDEDRSECNWYSSLHGKFYSHIEGMPYAEYEPGEYQVCNEEGQFEGLGMVGGEPYLQPFGHVPKEISLLTSLKYLKLRTHFEMDTNVAFPDMFPPPIPTLKYMELQFFQHQYKNQVGKGPIPTEVGLFPSVKNLVLRFNAATGTIPTQLALLTDLEELRLDQNLLTGSIPTELGALTSLTELELQDNRITGTIPSEIHLATKVERLVLHNNAINGSITSFIMKPLPYTDLLIQGNQFTGAIPSGLGSQTKLTKLQLHDNRFSGRLPSQLGLLTALTDLRLSGNRFSGPLPSQVRLLTNLRTLWLYSNNFSEVPNMTQADLAAELPKLTDLRLHSDSNEINYDATCNSQATNSTQYKVQNKEYGYLLNAKPGDMADVSTSAAHTSPDFVDRWNLITRCIGKEEEDKQFLVNAEHASALSFRRYYHVNTACFLGSFEEIKLVNIINLGDKGSFEACIFNPFWKTYLNGDAEGRVVQEEENKCDGGSVWQFASI